MRSEMYDKILGVAGRLFYSEGTRATGVDKIIAEADVAKATFYRHFPTKDALIEAYLEDRHHRIITTLSNDVQRSKKKPRERIRLIFKLLYDKADTPLFRGCAFSLTVAENEESTAVRAIAREHKRAIYELFRNILLEFVDESDELAKGLALCYEGALASIAIQRSPEPANTARRCADTLIDACIRNTPSVNALMS